MTVPAADARMGVPEGMPMSMPGWNEQSPFARQRGPYGLVIGPLTGQISPEADGAGLPVDPDPDPEDGAGAGRLSAARIRAASDALRATSCLASSAKTFSLTLI